MRRHGDGARLSEPAPAQTNYGRPRWRKVLALDSCELICEFPLFFTLLRSKQPTIIAHQTPRAFSGSKPLFKWTHERQSRQWSCYWWKVKHTDRSAVHIAPSFLSSRHFICQHPLLMMQRSLCCQKRPARFTVRFTITISHRFPTSSNRCSNSVRRWMDKYAGISRPHFGGCVPP